VPANSRQKCHSKPRSTTLLPETSSIPQLGASESIYQSRYASSFDLQTPKELTSTSAAPVMFGHGHPGFAPQALASSRNPTLALQSRFLIFLILLWLLDFHTLASYLLSRGWMILSAEMLDIIAYLKTAPNKFISLQEISRRAGGRRRFEEASNWARNLMAPLLDARLIEVNARGHYCCVASAQPEAKAQAPAISASRPPRKPRAEIVGGDYFPANVGPQIVDGDYFPASD
jgi:hypothetical protein